MAAIKEPSDEQPSDASTDAPSSPEHHASIWTVPNMLSGIRLGGAIALAPLSLFAEAWIVGVVFAFSVVTDWFDGKLAMLLNQQTKFGARLDSVADGSLYTALLFSLCWLKWDFVSSHWPGIATAVASYVGSVLFSYAKFRCLPSYHTYAAKVTWHLLNLAVFLVFMNWSTWPFDVTMAIVVLVNLEAMAITAALRECRVDVRSFWLLGNNADQAEESREPAP